MDGSLLPTSVQGIPSSGRVSSDRDGGSQHVRLSSVSSRAPEDKLDEHNDAGRQSYEYIMLKPTGGGGKFNPRMSVYNHDAVETAPWRCGEKYQYGSIEAAGSWQKCHRLVKKYDADICDAWREEVDKLLIFAGLFSATVTAFTIESYQWLQPDSLDATSQFLAFIASEYAQSRNTTLPSSLLHFSSNTNSSPTTGSGAPVRINTFWFLSLTLSLTTVLIGILCLQWLREFQRDASLPHKDALALRQMRFEGLLSWHVPTILSALPVLLQMSLLLFFAGLLDLLWDRNHIVAAVITAAVGLVACFLGATTALPALQFVFTRDEYLKGNQCPYKSPQSWLYMRVTQWTFRLAQVMCTWWTSESFDWPVFHRLLKSAATDLNWSNFDMRWRRHRDAGTIVWGTPKESKDSEDITDVVHWVNDAFAQSPDAVYPIYHCLGDLDIPAASDVISTLYRGSPFEETTFRVMMDNRFSPNVIQKREIISTFFLHAHQEQHLVIKPLYIESVVRILNTQEVPAPFLDWLSTILQEISSLIIAAQQPGRISLTGIADPQILTQTIGCASMLAARSNRRNIDVVNTWILLDTLLWGVHHNHERHDKDLDGETGLDTVARSIDMINPQHITLASIFFKDIAIWVTKNTRELELRERAEICMEGLMLMFPEFLTREEMGILKLRYPEFKSALELVRVLDGMASQLSLGMGSYVVGFDSWPRVYDNRSGNSIENWKRLVTKFML